MRQSRSHLLAYSTSVQISQDYNQNWKAKGPNEDLSAGSESTKQAYPTEQSLPIALGLPALPLQVSRKGRNQITIKLGLRGRSPVASPYRHCKKGFQQGSSNKNGSRIEHQLPKHNLTQMGMLRIITLYKKNVCCRHVAEGCIIKYSCQFSFLFMEICI